ncbi:protein FAM81A [Elysia marginata]|uniref:Protein FAM81A n=1 Tax=Elysia marginata TaxID=1093978 RepID=A0AAV4JPY3_9GAST|nr:protein FAM81A [Elysia marginata]
MALRRYNNLPSLRAPYDTTHEYNAISVGSPRALEREPVVDSRQVAEIVPLPIRSDLPSRIEQIEDRLSLQERNTQALIDRAFKIKEDVIDSLNFTQGTWNEEKQARGLLQEHIRTITACVNKLNGDIATLEGSIKARDTAHVTTNSAVKNLEVHHVQSLTDLRGRVVRCDSSISKLSGDIRSCFESIKQLSHQQQEMQSRMMDRMHGLEAQERLVKKIDEGQYVTDARIAKLEDLLNESRNSMNDAHSSLESKLLARMDRTVQKHSEEIAKLKRECREGFTTVHESISNMKTVMEGKRKILEDQLRKEISQIRKMVVLV